MSATLPCLAEVPILKRGHLVAEVPNNSENRGLNLSPYRILEVSSVMLAETSTKSKLTLTRAQWVGGLPPTSVAKRQECFGTRPKSGL